MENKRHISYLNKENTCDELRKSIAPCQYNDEQRSIKPYFLGDEYQGKGWNELYEEQRKNYKPYILFGRYPQKIVPKEVSDEAILPIEWRILKVYKNRVLLISRYILNFVRITGEKNTLTEYAKSNYRKWLNESFFNAAFSAEEQQSIESINTAETEDNPVYDRVFLLSSDQVDYYFEPEYVEDGDIWDRTYSRTYSATDYANGFVVNASDEYYDPDDYSHPWLLRNSNSAGVNYCVDTYGNLKSMDQSHSFRRNRRLGLVPAIWVRIE